MRAFQRDWLIGPIVLLGVLGFFGGLIWALASYSAREDRQALEEYDRLCAIYARDIVRSRLDGRLGMVTAYRPHWREVAVRFAQPQARTDISLLGADGAIANAPYSLVWMKCFEVERVTEEQPE